MSSFKTVTTAKPEPLDEDDDYIDVDEYHDILDELLDPADDDLEDYLQLELDGKFVMIPFSTLLAIVQLASDSIMPEPSKTMH